MPKIGPPCVGRQAQLSQQWKAGPTLRPQRSHTVWAGLTAPAQADRPNRQPQPVIQVDGSGQGGPTSTACLRLCLLLLTCSMVRPPSPAPGRSGLSSDGAAGPAGVSVIGKGAGGSAACIPSLASTSLSVPLPCSRGCRWKRHWTTMKLLNAAGSPVPAPAAAWREQRGSSRAPALAAVGCAPRGRLGNARAPNAA